MVLASVRNLIPLFIREKGWTATDTPRKISGRAYYPLGYIPQTYHREYPLPDIRKGY